MSPPNGAGRPGSDSETAAHQNPLPEDGSHPTEFAQEERLAALVEYFDTFFGNDDGSGFLHNAVGKDPYLTDKGNYKFGDWKQYAFKWPAEDHEAAILQAVLDEALVGDVYVCPYLMAGTRRAKHCSMTRRFVHTEVDGQLDYDKVGALGGLAVASGSPGHSHVYVPLTESVSFAHHEQLCRALRDYLGAKDAKVCDNDLLRPPGTLNHKPRVYGGEPVPVVWLIRPDGVGVDPQELAGLLGVELTDTPPAPKPKAKSQSKSRDGASSASGDDVEPFDLLRYPLVRRALATVSDPPDRSVDTMRVIGACARNGLNEGNARWAVAQREDLAERLFDERHDDDVARCWRKAEDSREGDERRGIFRRRGW